MTGVVKRSFSQSQILKGIQDKTIAGPKYLFDGFRYKGEVR